MSLRHVEKGIVDPDASTWCKLFDSLQLELTSSTWDP